MKNEKNLAKLVLIVTGRFEITIQESETFTGDTKELERLIEDYVRKLLEKGYTYSHGDYLIFYKDNVLRIVKKKPGDADLLHYCEN